jgi:hypothetical protein
MADGTLDSQVGARICNGLGIMRACLETQNFLESRMDLPPDNATGITKIVDEIVHRTAEQALMEETPLEITFVRSHEIGNGGLNEDTARTKR